MLGGTRRRGGVMPRGSAVWFSTKSGLWPWLGRAVVFVAKAGGLCRSVRGGIGAEVTASCCDERSAKSLK